MRCPNCSEENPPKARFCVGCGQALAPSAGQTSLQRILTLIFIDLVDSTKMAAERELEQYDSLLTRFHETVAEAIGEYGGTVLQLYGDGVLACFGLSEDSENSALSALAAGLAIVETLPRELNGAQARAGIHSGTVLCRIQDRGQLLPQVTGLDVNIAARVQSEAKAGGVATTEATLNFVERIARVDTTDLGTKRLKGVPEPLQLFQIERYEFADSQRPGDRLIERDDVIISLIEQPADASEWTVNVIVGEAGIGKSVLLEELERRLGNAYHHIHLSARLNLRHTPLFPVVEWLARALGYQHFPIGSDQSAQDLPDRLARLWPEVPAGSIPILESLLGLGPSSLYAHYAAAQVQDMYLNQLVDLVYRLTERQAVVLTFDDFHWADAASREFLDRLLERGALRASKAVITTRPYPQLMDYAKQRSFPIVRLNALSRQGALTLLLDSGFDDFAEAERDQILNLSEGNPLFLKTLLKLFVRDGSIAQRTTVLPPTIDATFQATINSFGDLKELLLTAAVIGRLFTTAELTYLIEDQSTLSDGLAALVRDGILVEAKNGWQFSHILLQETAYKMLPTSRQREFHKQFADALIKHEPKRVEELPELVADHYVASGESTHIASSCLQAGLSFLQRTSFERAEYYLRTAVKELEQSGDPRLLSALTSLAAAKVQRLGFAHPETVASYRNLENAISDAREHPLERVQALYHLFAQRIMSGNIRSGLPVLREMEGAAEPGDSLQDMLRLNNLCAYQLYSGRFTDALETSAAIESLYDPVEHGRTFLALGADPLVGALTAAANVYALRGQLNEASAAFEAAEAHVESIGAALLKPWVLIFTGSALSYTPGAIELALERISEGSRIADEQGAGFWSLNGRLWQSVIASELGRPEQAPSGMLTLIEQQQSIGIGLNRPLFFSVYAQDLHRQGDSKAALDLMVRACRQAAVTGQGQWTAEIWRKRAEICRDLGQTSEAHRCRRIALLYAERNDSAVWKDRCLDSLAPAVS